MKEQHEPRSPFKANSIWNSARIKSHKKLWNFQNKKNRGNLPELPNKIKSVGFRTGIFRLGPYEGTLEEIKEFARMKGLEYLTQGAIKYKIA